MAETAVKTGLMIEREQCQPRPGLQGQTGEQPIIDTERIALNSLPVFYA